MTLNQLALYGWFLSIPIVIYLGRYFMTDEDWEIGGILWVVIMSWGLVPSIIALILMSPVIAIVLGIAKLAQLRRVASL